MEFENDSHIIIHREADVVKHTEGKVFLVQQFFQKMLLGSGATPQIVGEQIRSGKRIEACSADKKALVCMQEHLRGSGINSYRPDSGTGVT
ncbi:MAG: hypothetical protein IJ512_05575 [Ruminococcus sp.]|nr:hypothetical protein [Ruminococcus sp.]